MAFDAFLKLSTIPGESTDDKHKEWIEVISFSLGVDQPTTGVRSTGGAASAERADIRDLSIVKVLDKASPKLFYHCCNGTHIPEASLELCRATGDKTRYMEYKLSDVIISSVRPGGQSRGGETLPLEEVSLNFGKIELTYTQTDPTTGKPKGDVKHYWDLKTNKGG